MNNIYVTYFASYTSRVHKIISLSQVLSDFRTGSYEPLIQDVRRVLAEEGCMAYSKAKKHLPVIAFCEEFSGGHAKSNIVKYNNLMIIKSSNCIIPTQPKDLIYTNEILFYILWI